jgi:IS5 family transposase
MISKDEFLKEIWHSLHKSAMNLWLKNFSLDISKKRVMSIISRIQKYLSLDSVFVNVHDVDFISLILQDFKEAIYDFLHRTDDYVFLRNLKESKRHKENVLRDEWMFYDEFLDFESYRKILELSYNPSKLGGRKPFDPVFMQKITFLKFILDKTDAQILNEIKNNEAYQCFLGYPKEYPCASTLWNFRERIKEKGLDNVIWDHSHFLIENHSIFKGFFQMQDASFFETDPGHQKVSVPRGKEAKTRRSKEGTFTKKGDKKFFGYKIHNMMDLKTSIIYDYKVTTASLHDININLTDDYKVDFKDRGYSKKEFKQFNGIMTKSARNHPINIHEKRRNKRISSKRAPGERVYTYFENLTDQKTKLTEIERVNIQVLNILLYFNMKQVIRLKTREKTSINEKIEENEDIYQDFVSSEFFNNLSLYFNNFDYINFGIARLGKKCSKIPQIEINNESKPKKVISTSKAEYRRNIKRELGKKRKKLKKKLKKKYKEIINSLNEFKLIIS